MNKLTKHFTDWPEFYLAMPLVVLAVCGAGQLVLLLTHRQPIESLGWIVDLSQRAAQVAASILFVSLCRQAFGHWLTKDEYLAHPVIGTIQSIIAFSGLCVLLYFFSH